MTIRKLPVLQGISNRTGIAFEALPAATQRWNGNIRAASENENVISILDPIGADFFGEGVTAKRISAALRSIGNQDVVVNVNSPGGDFFEGVAIYNLFQAHSKKVTMRILGMAASAASIIAMAGDEIQIARAGFIMIHNTQAIVVGDRNDMREFADALEIFDASISGVYVARTGLEEKVIARMMDKETILSGSDAIEKGFADEFLASDVISEDVENESAFNATSAIRRLDVIMASAGVARSERKELINQLRGMPGAAATGMPGAADDATPGAGVHPDLFAKLNKIDIPLTS